MFINRRAAESYRRLMDAKDEVGEVSCENFPEAWFPERENASDSEVKLAKELCGQCPIKKQCLEFALTNEEAHGLWGGMHASERLLLLRKTQRVA